MSQENLVDEVLKKLKCELKMWTARLPHYNDMYLILDQYAREYIDMVDVINNIESKGDEIDKDILRFLIKEDNVLEFITKKNLNIKKRMTK